MSKKSIKIAIVAIVLSTLIISPSIYAMESDDQGDCVPLEVKIFGFKILNKYHRGCSMSSLPDGRWDWFPN